MTSRRLPLADTPLAEWLVYAMARWVDPDLGLPGLSGNQLSVRTGIDRTTISNILKQGHIPNHHTLNKLAKFFEIDPLELYRLAYLEKEVEDG